MTLISSLINLIIVRGNNYIVVLVINTHTHIVVLYLVCWNLVKQSNDVIVITLLLYLVFWDRKRI